jgi:hypothetical protein
VGERRAVAHSAAACRERPGGRVDARRICTHQGHCEACWAINGGCSGGARGGGARGAGGRERATGGRAARGRAAREEQFARAWRGCGRARRGAGSSISITCAGRLRHYMSNGRWSGRCKGGRDGAVVKAAACSVERPGFESRWRHGRRLLRSSQQSSSQQRAPQPRLLSLFDGWPRVELVQLGSRRRTDQAVRHLVASLAPARPSKSRHSRWRLLPAQGCQHDTWRRDRSARAGTRPGRGQRPGSRVGGPGGRACGSRQRRRAQGRTTPP